MAKLPDDNDRARFILDTFQHFGTKPGECLMQKNFLHHGANNNVSPADIARGIDVAYDNGWVDGGKNNTIFLTEDGYAAI